ncbi:shikimate 5-dehydrogenase [Nitritalea halalkaliphila LW7]|uniref:Shikimate 5-dehydrogenase n=1 Tax=Nitritalea halalkaliphila LW7 TaxID=1189621 RepID=I5C5Q9_9BACT|nr:shikimate 5-dehydrogenase [Nitritalea halalkaliphila]EIM77161.1 shikimate 5-dehydrogenase [Nitritalea halalkaliphila LW7]
MKQYGLIGKTLSHSFSKRYFTEKFEREGLSAHAYALYELASIEEARSLLQQPLAGLNVTIPYKEAIIPYLDRLDPACASIGAVNCIAFEKGQMVGYNTDYLGFKQSLQQWLSEHPEPASTAPLQALVLGSGGAAKAVLKALEDLHIPALTVSRSASGPAQISYETLKQELQPLPDAHPAHPYYPPRHVSAYRNHAPYRPLLHQCTP